MFKSRYSQESSYICFKDLLKIGHKLTNAANATHDMHPCKLFKNFNEITDVLDNFGDLFTRLIVDFEYIGIPNSIEIVKRINDRCTALKVLHLKNCHGHNILADLNGEFTTVHSLTFSTHPTFAFAIHPDDKTLPELFPNLIYLNLEEVRNDDWTHFRGNFSGLQTIKVQPANSVDFDKVGESNLFKFLQNKTNIIGFGFVSSNVRLLCTVNDILPKLRVLSLEGLSNHYINLYCGLINFQDVIRFDFESKSGEDVPEKLGLKHIDQLNLRIPFEFKDEWNDFLREQVNDDLSELALSIASVKTEQFLEIAQNLPNLVRAFIECPSIFGAEDIARFVEKNEKLQHLKLEILMHESERTKFLELLTANWSVKYEPRMLNNERWLVHITMNR